MNAELAVARRPEPAAASPRLRLDPRALLRAGLVALAAGALVVGFAAHLAERPELAARIWLGGTVPVLAALLVEIVTSLRRGEVGLDIVAALSMSAALAFGENLAAVVVALMYAGGQYLESHAERRARREMTALLARAPRSAVRHRDGALEEVELDAVSPGDRLLVRHGEIVPVDGVLETTGAVLDASSLTGEALPVRPRPGEAVLSGSTNVGPSFDMTASRVAAESTYAGIVRLVEAAQRSKAPMSRLADRYAIVFLLVTVAAAGGTWLFTGDPIRMIAVLVVATPCPLILAVPVAIVSGVSRAARHGILVKGGRPLEALARIDTVVTDKTGTLTHGTARLVSAAPEPGFTAGELLRLAASLDQASKHPIAEALVAEARERGLSLAVPSDAVETAGAGVEGLVEGRRLAVGGAGFVAGLTGASPVPDAGAGAVTVAVAVDSAFAGTLVLSDRLRHGTADLLADLRGLGIRRIVLATGDRPDVARAVVDGLGFDAVEADLAPRDKTALVAAERRRGTVMMVGDGVNDAPALAAADLGVAMGARGAAASAEAADVVLLVDRLDRIAPAIRIARRARAIALQSVTVGLGLSFAGMAAAAFGYLTPVQGALMQEVIDVAVILNALRALGGPDPLARTA